MHTKPMAEHEGTFQDDWKSCGDWACPHCKVAGQVVFRAWDSDCGGYTDLKYHCRACNKTWWVEGPDA